MAQELYYPAAQLTKAIARAQAEHRVVAALYTSDRCPFCIALKKEQLTPRMRSDALPALLVVEFDADKSKRVPLPNGNSTTVTEWARQHRLTLFPTLVMLDVQGNPITAPLVGYGSRDFYPSYLEDQIKAAEAIALKSTAPRI